MADSEKDMLPDGGFAISRKSFLLILAGFLIMVLGYVLMAGGGSAEPSEFNPEIFSPRRVTLAPIVVIAGIVVEIVAIMKVFKK